MITRGLARAVGAATVLLALLASALADEDGGLPIAGEVQWLPVGEARLRILFWSIYDARLFTESGRYKESVRPLRLQLTYLMDISSKELAERTLDEWRNMGRSDPRQGEWIAQIKSLWPDIEKGDVVEQVIDEAGVTHFSHNGRVLGRIEDPDFGIEYLDIWLSEDTTRPELRRALLGLDR